MTKRILLALLALCAPLFLQAEATLDQKIGQMIILGFQGTELSESSPIHQAIRKGKLGGVILHDVDLVNKKPVCNITAPEQLKALTASLQSVAPIPLFVAIDQEGGFVSRLNPERGFPPSHSAKTLGDQNDLEHTYAEARKMAETQKEAGINLNFAPVVDVATSPDGFIARRGRSFSSDPQVVADQANAFIDAHHDAGVLCTLKHFCGHGSAAGDSHWGMVDVTDTWDASELIPFQKLIEAGKVDMVMTAHIVHRSLDNKNPATLSKKIIQGILRDQLGYEGVVITDDINMQAIADRYTPEETFEKLINAGVDMIIVGNNLTVYDENATENTISTIKQLITEGRISEAQIDAAYNRIQQLKARL